MIFQDGELRRIVSSKPMLFDGWAYVPIELVPYVPETPSILEHEPAEPDMSPAPTQAR